MKVKRALLALSGLLLAWSGPAAAADETARFELTLDIIWSAGTAPFEFPEGAHLSRLFGATHGGCVVLFRDGWTASSGLELLAENGRGSLLLAEFAEAQRRGRLGRVIEGPGLGTVPGRVRVEFEATREHDLVSFVTMLAPSPDWFTGLADIRLLRDGDWIEEARFPLWAWDGGTDDGATYAAANADTQPRQSIRLLATPHVLGPQGLVRLGTAELRRLPP